MIRKSSADGPYLLALGIAVFLSLGLVLGFTAKTSMGDFKLLYYGSRCMLQHCDPYNPSEFLRFYQAGVLQPEARSTESVTPVPPSTNLPSTLFLVAPLAFLPFRLASGLWMLLTAASLILGSILTWSLTKNFAPIVSGALIALVMVNCAAVFANGNAAGIAIGLGAIAVWCFLRERFVPAGILCLAISLAIKPHDMGFVWLYFLLAGSASRRRALQSLVASAVLCLTAFVWAFHVAPQWMPEVRSNLAGVSTHGGNDDPGPEGPTSVQHGMEAIVDLQAVTSVFLDVPRFYNLSSYIIGGALLLAWLVTTFRAGSSSTSACFALAAIAPLSLLVTYHRAYDARILLLTIPACAMLWTRGGKIGRAALCVNLAGIALTGEIALAILAVLTKNLHADAPGIFQKIRTIVLMRPGSLSLLVMGIFYLWVYVRAVSRVEGTREQWKEVEPITVP